MIQISQRWALQQKQSPQQVLLSTLLQLPVLRLEQRIKQELELNPLLELETDIEEEIELKTEEEKPEDEEKEEEETETENEDEIDWEEILNDENNLEIHQPREKREDDITRPEPAPVTLMDHLFEQLHLTPLKDDEMRLGEYILWCIDDDGYLASRMEDIVEDMNVPYEMVEKVLGIIQRFDPVGIGARDLRECLLIQLQEMAEPDQLAMRMLRECFDDFSNKRYEKIAKRLDIPLPEVKRIMELVSKLNPKPGERYISEAENYIIPDVLVERVDNDFHIVLNDWNIPRLRINESYKQLLRDKKQIGKETRDYIRQRLESAP